MKKWMLAIPAAAIAAIIALASWPRPSEDAYVQQIREKNAILQSDTYSYTGRVNDTSQAPDFIFSDGTHNLYVSLPDLKVSSIRAAAAENLNGAGLMTTEAQAKEMAESWFMKLFPEAQELDTDVREAVQAYQVEVSEVKEDIPTGNTGSFEIRGAGELAYADILYSEKEFTSDDIKITEDEARQNALSAVNELNCSNYKGVREIKDTDLQNARCSLKVVKDRIYYQVEFTAPVTSDNQNFEETYTIQIDARNGKCKSIANTAQNGYDKW